jgi:hypothetical protein
MSKKFLILIAATQLVITSVFAMNKEDADQTVPKAPPSKVLNIWAKEIEDNKQKYEQYRKESRERAEREIYSSGGQSNINPGWGTPPTQGETERLHWSYVQSAWDRGERINNRKDK